MNDESTDESREKMLREPVQAQSADAHLPRAWPRLYRLAGLLPLSFFIVRLIEYIQVGTPSHMLWNCHVGNLILAAGLFFGLRSLIGMAVLWLILGIPPWIYDMFVIRIFNPVAFYSHVGGFLVSLWIISRIGLAKMSSLLALVWHLVWQQVTRFTTPPAFNINIAQRPYTGFEHLFSSYWQYWLAQAVLAAVSLLILAWVLRMIFPAPPAKPDRMQVQR